MKKEPLWKQTCPTVYRIKHADNGTYITGGHGAMQGIYASIQGVKAGLRRLKESYTYRDDNFIIEIYELSLKETISTEELLNRK